MALLNELFTLLEYSRDKTLSIFANKLEEKSKKDPTARGKSPEQVLDELERGDPTKKKNYVQWLTKIYVNSDVRLEDLTSGAGDDLIAFDRLKQKKKLGADADIGKLKSVSELSQVVSKYMHNLEDDKSKKERGEEQRGQYKKIHDGKEVSVVQLFDKAAAQFFGKGTDWCTAAQGSNYYEHYAKQGDMYVVLPKNPKRYNHSISGKPREEKYQLHLASKSCKDENDHGFKFGRLLDKYPELIEVFGGIDDFKGLKQLSRNKSEEERKRIEQERIEREKAKEAELDDFIQSLWD